MIVSVLVSLSAAAAPASRYELCGISANSVAEVKRQVRASSDYKDLPDSGKWHARINEKALTSWLFPDPTRPDAEIAICRAFIKKPDGVYADTQLICDGSDAACDAERNRLLGSSANGGRTPQ